MTIIYNKFIFLLSNEKNNKINQVSIKELIKNELELNDLIKCMILYILKEVYRSCKYKENNMQLNFFLLNLSSFLNIKNIKK